MKTMERIIMHPGDGVNFPKKGDYVKLNLFVYGEGKKVIFDSKTIPEKCVEMRYKLEGLWLDEIESLIGEMSMFEKCSLEFKLEHYKKDNSDETKNIRDLLSYHKNIIFEIEITNISCQSHNN
jgi:hypothetical protein